MAWKHVYGEQHLKRGLYINKILYGVIDLPLWVFNPIANSPCRTRGRAWDAPVADPNLLTFFTRPTPNRLVVRLSRVWPCRTGEPEGSGPRVSPSRYKEVILLPQQTLAGERRPTACDPKIGRRRQDGRPKSTVPPSRQPSCPQQPRSLAAGQHPYRSETGGRGHLGEGAPARFTHGPTAFPHRPGQSSLCGRQPTTEGKEGTPSTVADQESFRRGEAGAMRAGRRPAVREPAPPRREARSASCRRGRRAGAKSVFPARRQPASRPQLSSSQPPRAATLQEVGRARPAAEGKLGPLTPAAEIRE